MLPDGDEGSDTVLAVVEEDNPVKWLVWLRCTSARVGNSHSVRVHGLADKELVVLEVANDLLGEARGLGLKVLDGLLAGTLLSESLLDRLHVGCHVQSVRVQRQPWPHLLLR